MKFSAPLLCCALAVSNTNNTFSMCVESSTCNLCFMALPGRCLKLSLRDTHTDPCDWLPGTHGWYLPRSSSLQPPDLPTVSLEQPSQASTPQAHRPNLPQLYHC